MRNGSVTVFRSFDIGCGRGLDGAVSDRDAGRIELRRVFGRGFGTGLLSLAFLNVSEVHETAASIACDIACDTARSARNRIYTKVNVNFTLRLVF